jgi:Enoyl-CoA hydratase/isomerase
MHQSAASAPPHLLHAGLWPDVGFALKAATCPGALGLHLALTGAKLSDPGDLLYLGIATHYMPAASLQVRGENMLLPGEGLHQG